MTEIIDGKVIKEDITTKAMGGTELMAHRMAKYISRPLLQDIQIIHSRIRTLHPDKKKVFVAHDLPNDPEAIKAMQMKDEFDKIVFVSQWQFEKYRCMFPDLKYDDCVIIKNAIEPIEVDFHKDKNFDTIKLIYHTTPHRGLEILYHVFDKLCEYHDNIQLDVYSSFEIYGWKERDEQYKKLFDLCKNHDKITYHGSVSNDEIREKLKETHIFAYPSIWPETSCLAAIEALSAMNYVVCPNYGALPETCMNFAWSYHWSENVNIHASRFFNVLHILINNLKSGNFHDIMVQKSLIDPHYDMKNRKLEWENLLKGLKNG